jgi:hypothetical protein
LDIEEKKQDMSSADSTITPRTVVDFLLFQRDAILKVAASKSAFWIGLLFVIAAGFAREYDGEYLISEPWHLVLPLAASLIGCTAMVLPIYLFLKCNGEKESSFAEVFRSFLNVYWMTAPLALVYGIPVERIFDPGDATRANLYLLAIVAVWRVLLMIRCVYVLCSTSIWRSTIIVLLFSDALAMLALYYVPGPIFMIMGGVRLTESERIILSIRHLLILLCYGTILVWVVGYIAICCRRCKLAFYRSNEENRKTNPVPKRSAWLLAIAAICFWIPFLFVTQPEQQLRWTCERMIAEGNFIEFGQVTADYPREAFPPHWDPPPRVGYREQEPLPFLVLHGLLESDAAKWAIDAYKEKFNFIAARNGWRVSSEDETRNYSEHDVEKMVEVLERIEGGNELAWEVYIGLANGDEEWQSEKRQALVARIESVAGVAEEGSETTEED